MTRYKLTARAADDIVEIYLWGLAEFGEAHAEQYHAGLHALFHVLASYPQLARRRSELNPPLRLHPYKAHIVLYQEERDEILIVRVRHSHEDWMSEPLGR